MQRLIAGRIPKVPVCHPYPPIYGLTLYYMEQEPSALSAYTGICVKVLAKRHYYRDAILNARRPERTLFTQGWVHEILGILGFRVIHSFLWGDMSA